MPKGLDEENFGKLAVRRNQIIASLLFRANFVENMGTGINKITSLLKENGNIAPIFQFDSFYKITLRRTDELTDELNKGQKMVFAFIKNNPNKMAKDIAHILNMPFGTVDRHIRVLLKKSLIERKGSKKAGGYFVKKIVE